MYDLPPSHPATWLRAGRPQPPVGPRRRAGNMYPRDTNTVSPYNPRAHSTPSAVRPAQRSRAFATVGTTTRIPYMVETSDQTDPDARTRDTVAACQSSAVAHPALGARPETPGVAPTRRTRRSLRPPPSVFPSAEGHHEEGRWHQAPD